MSRDRTPSPVQIVYEKEDCNGQKIVSFWGLCSGFYVGDLECDPVYETLGAPGCYTMLKVKRFLTLTFLGVFRLMLKPLSVEKGK